MNPKMLEVLITIFARSALLYTCMYAMDECIHIAHIYICMYVCMSV